MNASERFCNAYTQHRGTLLGPSGTEHGWLRQLQDKALESFTRQGVPGPGVESWKYTRLNQIEQCDFSRADYCARPSIHINPDVLPVCSDSLRLVFINGSYEAGLSSLSYLPEGIALCSFSEALFRHQKWLSPLLGKIAGDEGHPFAALNAMLMADGVFLRVAKGTRLQTPIHCLFISTAIDKPIVSSPRLLVELGEQTEVSLIEHYLASESLGANGGTGKEQNDSPILANSLIEVALGREARMQHYKLQSESSIVSHISGLHVEQQRGSAFSSHNLSLGAGLSRNDIHIKLVEEEAECRLYGAYCIGGKQHVDFHTQIDHYKPSCTSRELYKGVIQDRARAVFNGMVVVHPDAQGSDAQLVNKNLLLSAKAEVDTKPELQIYADDVKCGHGATVGQLDPAALFYLQTRCIAAKDAQALLVNAFITEILQSMESAAVRQFLQPPVLTQLNALIGSTSPMQVKEQRV
ncbi:Fe-S cluster assembly protein SufD [Photobacterium sp. SDRW27]|uniref:Fe-S cluster assembly protein SufD n=1 Tax=Photobacterium obscurum TaxID=2829490 RepID=UPI00224429B2|nr:Fe-S cluster assembly protein SufD [Photobacterium obscurum]MCW8331431.1 Fe-S cluster assembly protein SufD [Photobacterium obscurum]